MDEPTGKISDVPENNSERPLVQCLDCQGTGKVLVLRGGDPAGGPHYSPGDSYEEQECARCSGSGFTK